MVRAANTWSLHYRLIVIAGIVALIDVGRLSALIMNITAYLDLTPPLVEVLSQNRGASPEEMERLVGIPLDPALNGMPGLEVLRSTSITGLNDMVARIPVGTHAIRVLDSIPNPQGRRKSDMIVRTKLRIPPNRAGSVSHKSRWLPPIASITCSFEGRCSWYLQRPSVRVVQEKHAGRIDGPVEQADGHVSAPPQSQLVAFIIELMIT